MVDVRGSDLGVLIGRHGETLDSFQYVSALMIGKEAGQFVHVLVDVEGHRDRRERQLRQLAQRVAEQVLKTGRKRAQADARPNAASFTELGTPGGDDRASARAHRKVTISPK
jgi:spoIIIJ-associated protein